MIPLAERMQKVSLPMVIMPIQWQEIITSDNVSIGVAAAAYYRRSDPGTSILEVTDRHRAELHRHLPGAVPRQRPRARAVASGGER